MIRATSMTAAPVLALALALALAISGCDTTDDDDSDLSLAPSDCTLSEPAMGTFIVKVTISERQPTVPVTIRLGELETGSLVLNEDVSTAVTQFELFTDEDYTITALYVIGADSVLVVDSGKIQTSSTEFSDATCWSVTDAKVDLQLQVTP